MRLLTTADNYELDRINRILQDYFRWHRLVAGRARRLADWKRVLPSVAGRTNASRDFRSSNSIQPWEQHTK